LSWALSTPQDALFYIWIRELLSGKHNFLAPLLTNASEELKYEGTIQLRLPALYQRALHSFPGHLYKMLSATPFLKEILSLKKVGGILRNIHSQKFYLNKPLIHIIASLTCEVRLEIQFSSDP